VSGGGGGSLVRGFESGLCRVLGRIFPPWSSPSITSEAPCVITFRRGSESVCDLCDLCKVYVVCLFEFVIMYWFGVLELKRDRSHVLCFGPTDDIACNGS